MILNLTDQNKLGFLAIAEEPAVMFLCEFLWDQFQSISTGTVERKAVFPEISKIMAHRYRFILRSFFVSGILAEAVPAGKVVQMIGKLFFSWDVFLDLNLNKHHKVGIEGNSTVTCIVQC